MRRSRTRDRSAALAAVWLLSAVAGCAGWNVPRIDPSGQSVFVVEPAPPGDFRPEPAPHTFPLTSSVCVTPASVVAPVGSEVVLLAAVRGEDNYLRTNERVEWTIAPGGVGHFLAVGRNWLSDWLFGEFNRGIVDATFAIGTTSRSNVRLTRGTPTPTDDVLVNSGQAWVSVTSPIEGTSYVTAYAPNSVTWECNKQTAAVHWIDAQWQFPPPAINPAGTRHMFITTVTRHSDQSGCAGWRVRYQIVEGPPAGFAPNGAPVAEVEVNPLGQAGAEIFQTQPGPGTNRVSIQIIRPSAPCGPAGKPFVVACGSTLKTWTSPQIAVRKTGPAVVGPGATLGYRIVVSNPGDLSAGDVLVTDEVPEAMAYVGSNPPAEVNGRRLQWRVGQLGPRESRALEVGLRAGPRGSATSCAEATAAGGLKARDCATTAIAAPTLDVRIRGPEQATVGESVSFEVLVTNRGAVPAANLLILDRFEPGLEHPASRDSIKRELGDLAPGQTQSVTVDFRVGRAGRLCHTVEISDAGGLLATAQACLAAKDAPGAKPEPPPAVTIKKTGPTTANVGEPITFTITVSNPGPRRLTGLHIVDRCDASLLPQSATEGYQRDGDDLTWDFDALEVNGKTEVQVVCRVDKPQAHTCNHASVTSREGARAETEACLEVHEVPKPPPAVPSLAITAASLNNPRALGGDVTFEVKVTNDGKAPDQQVAVTVTVPDGMFPVTFGTRGPTAAAQDGQKFRFEPAPELPPGQSLTYSIRARTQQPGNFRLRAEVTSRSHPKPLAAEAATEVFRPQTP